MKCLIGLALTFSAVFCQLSIVSGEESVSYAGQTVQPNCTSKLDIETCNMVCKQNGVCIELPKDSEADASSACLCRSKPAFTPQVRCEQGQKDEADIIFADNDVHMAQCFRLTQAFPNVDYYSCAPAFRPLICAANDNSDVSGMQTRAATATIAGCSVDTDTLDLGGLITCLGQIVVATIDQLVAKVVEIITTIVNSVKSLLSKLSAIISSVVNDIVLSGERRRRRSIN